MITYYSDNFKVGLQDGIKSILGSTELNLFKPRQIEKVFSVIVKNFPVDEKDLPKLPKSISISSFKNDKDEELNVDYRVCNQADWIAFIDDIKKNVDAITLNTFVSQNRLAAHFFSIPEK